MSKGLESDLLDSWFNGELDEAALAELNDLLLNSASLRKEFRARVKIHSALIDHHSEIEVKDFDPVLTFRQSRPPLRMLFGTAAAILLCLLVVGGIYISDPGPDSSVAKVISIHSPDGKLRRGESLPKGNYGVEAGMLELAFGRGVRVAVEGPAEFDLISADVISLTSGAISVDAGDRGKGFTVVTPAGEVIDHGTRFGVRIGQDGKSAEAHVFEGAVDVVRPEGKVRLVTDEAFSLNAGVALSSDPSAFPMPGHTLKAGLENGDFETAENYVEGMPVAPGIWGGDRRVLVASSGEDLLRPHSGSKMLKFLSTGSSTDSAVSQQKASELWQIVDLSQFTDRVNGGEVSAKMEGWFNRVSGVENSAFEVQLFAFRGQMSLARKYWDRKNEPSSEKLASTGALVLIDENPVTWEPLEVGMAIPPGTDFLLVSILAFENETDLDENEFAGHFADSVRLTLTAKARESIPSARWAGEGNWKKAANWQDGENPDPSFDRVDISGGGEVLISDRVIVKQSLTLALHNGSSGRLRISPTGELIKSGFGELLVGYNPGAIAELTVEGALRSQNASFIGRNNRSSKVDVNGGLWDAGESTIRMAQYGGQEEKTNSLLLIRNGGVVSAGALELIHDRPVVRVEQGELKVGALLIGGDDGTASVHLDDGTIAVRRLSFGSKEGLFNFSSKGKAVLRVSGEWTIDELWNLKNANWQIDGQTADPSGFEISPGTIDGERFTRMRVKNSGEN